MKKFLVRFLLIVILLGAGLFFHFGVYSEGVRAGMVVKISKKGTLFKTYEGQLDLQSFGAVRSSNKLSQTFAFSLYDDSAQLVDKLEEAALNGTRVRLRYEEKYIALPWLGDTKYFVTSVESAKKGQNQEDQGKYLE